MPTENPEYDLTREEQDRLADATIAHIEDWGPTDMLEIYPPYTIGDAGYK